MRQETVLQRIVGFLVLDKAPTALVSVMAGCVDGQDRVGRALVGVRMGALAHGDLRRAVGFVLSGAGGKLEAAPGSFWAGGDRQEK